MHLIAKIAVVGLLTMNSAHVWALGENERDALAVIGGVAIINSIHDHAHRDSDVSRIEPRWRREQSMQKQIQREYERGRRQRAEEIHQQRLQRAYACGYYGDCQ